MANDSKQKVIEFKEKIKCDAESLVVNTFPDKILELESLLYSSRFNRNNLSEICTDINIPIPDSNHNHDNNDDNETTDVPTIINNNGINGTKELVLPNGDSKSDSISPCNKNLTEMIEILKPLYRKLIEHTDKLQMWIWILTPRIEDGNNFGVSILETTMSLIRAVNCDALEYLDYFGTYFTNRAYFVTKIAKYPHVEDYRKKIQDYDEKFYVRFRCALSDILMHYTNLHDMITKNLERIKTPRSSNTESMY